MSFAATFITLYPEAFPGPLGVSILERARKDGLWSLDTVQLREFGLGKHRQVDETPAGGGAGLVLRPDVAAAAIDSLPPSDAPLIYPSPRGVPFTQALAQDWAAGPGLTFFCGRLIVQVIDEDTITLFSQLGGDCAAYPAGRTRNDYISSLLHENWLSH